MTKRGIAHIEIPAANRKASAEFYEKMFGWTIHHHEDLKYSTFESGNVGGGFTEIGDPFPQPGNVVVYVYSDDIEADLKKIESLGGKLMMPKTEIPGTGWFAMFSDPAGNTMALFTETSK